MTLIKPTKQQVVEALRKADGSFGIGPITAGHIADILVHAGIAEEPREAGWYWVKPHEGGLWFPAQFYDDGVWVEGDGSHFDPPIIGPRILPPQD